MKTMNLDEFAEHVQSTVEDAQNGHIMVLRDGKPVAVLLGIEHKDEEDWRYEISPEFWRMIEERRQQKGRSLDEVKQELLGDEDYHYSMRIEWSDENEAFMVFLPEFDSRPKAQGASYEEAVQQGQDALASLIETYEGDGRPLPRRGKLAVSISAA
jgi:predicted RNase H-like HicB family nuclease/antitoxin (DNA-binding transcriptional repressor) of toxin-antitoxin stability system